MKKFSFLLFFLITFSFLTAQTYELDKSFGDNGVVKVTKEGNSCIGYKIVPLENGSFLSYSTFENFDEELFGFEISKFDKTGHIDSSFANNGVYSMNSFYVDSPVDFCVLPDSRIVVQNMDSPDSIKLNILKENGSIDKTIVLNPFPHEIAVAFKCLFHNGFLYIGGNYTSQDSLFIIKTDLNGNLDSTFAENGILKSKNIGLFNYFDDMIFQDDNLIIYSTFNDPDDNLYSDIFRINTKGDIDTTFAGQGHFFFEGFGNVPLLLIDGKNRIILSSFYNNSIFRLTPNGELDNEFGNVGVVQFSELNETGNFFYYTVLNDNSILIFGSIAGDDEPFGIPIILSLSENGKKNNSFGNFGLFVNNIDKLAVNVGGAIDNNKNIITVGAYLENPDDDDYFKMYLTRLKSKTSSENKIILGKDLSISPNPVNTNRINFKFPDNIEGNICIDIIDLLGRSAFKVDIPVLPDENNELTLDIPNNLKNGLYLVIVNDGKEIMSKKIVLSR